MYHRADSEHLQYRGDTVLKHQQLKSPQGTKTAVAVLWEGQHEHPQPAGALHSHRWGQLTRTPSGLHKEGLLPRRGVQPGSPSVGLLTVHEGWAGSKASFPSPCLQPAARSALHVSQLYPDRSQLHQGRPAQPRPRPAEVLPHPSTSPPSASPAGYKPGARSGCDSASNYHNDLATQVTIFKLLLIAINLRTQQPNGIYRPGGRGQCLVFRS